MQSTISRWGNSLGLRIPKELAQNLGLREGVRVELSAEGDRIVISRPPQCYRLDDLLTGMTPEAMREAWEWGPEVGREIVDGA